jgi:hypothetical protein
MPEHPDEQARKAAIAARPPESSVLDWEVCAAVNVALDAYRAALLADPATVDRVAEAIVTARYPAVMKRKPWAKFPQGSELRMDAICEATAALKAALGS